VLRIGATVFKPRDFVKTLREEVFSSGAPLEKKYEVYVSKLYSYILDSIRSSSLLKLSTQAFIHEVCRSTSIDVLGVDVVPETFPYSVEELVEQVFRATHRVVSERVEELVKKGAVWPTKDEVTRYAKLKALEILAHCFEEALTRLGVRE
jgi:hypothetical protein